MLLYCPTCKLPLAKREKKEDHDVVRVIKNQGGNKQKLDIEIPTPSGSHYKIKCDNCGMGHIFLTIREGMTRKARVAGVSAEQTDLQREEDLFTLILQLIHFYRPSLFYPHPLAFWSNW